MANIQRPALGKYRALTAQGRTVDCSGDSPLAAMADAASRCEEGDFPAVLYSVDALGRMVEPAWGGRRGFAGAYPEGESPEDAERLFGPGAR
jgi:hypothetical protein